MTSACAWASAAWTAAGSARSCGIATDESRMRLIIMFWRIVSLAVAEAPRRRFVTIGSWAATRAEAFSGFGSWGLRSRPSRVCSRAVAPLIRVSSTA